MYEITFKCKMTIFLVEGTLVLWFGGLPWLWNYATDLVSRWGYTSDYEVDSALVFVFFFFILNQIRIFSIILSKQLNIHQGYNLTCICWTWWSVRDADAPSLGSLFYFCY
jgi:hypothetical protein